MIYSNNYKILIGHKNNKIKVLKETNNISVYKVFILSKNKKKYYYIWTVEKVLFNNKYKNCWMTISVSNPKKMKIIKRGWKNLRVGGHDHLGEAFRDFQIQIKSLKNQGIILALVSKNDEAIAIEAINNHPEMILSMEDFVTHRINWEDKAKNIVDIATNDNNTKKNIKSCNIIH